MAGLADRFKDSHRVLALTRRGTGESSRPDRGHTIDDHASDIVGFLDELGVARATLVPPRGNVVIVKVRLAR
jgi:pimeloyl-ACP methyl ester carboxylesterase